MLAARLLGEKEFSLTNLVKNFLGVQLEKGSQKADWAKRPLTEKMESYARNDTRYLKSIADLLRGTIDREGEAGMASGILRQIDRRLHRASFR